MSARSKPLQYETSKIVMQHLEANMRFRISAQAPALRFIEKLVPLRIKQLDIARTFFVLNETAYALERTPNGQVQPAMGRKESYRATTMEESIEALCSKIFGKRKAKIHVESLYFGAQVQKWRLPKLVVQNLKLPTIDIIGELGEVIASCPLKTVEIAVLDKGNLDDQNIRNAKHLTIGELDMDTNWLEMFRDWKSHGMVHVKKESVHVSVGDYVELIEHWLEHGRSKGTTFSFGTRTLKIRQVLDRLRRRPEVTDSQRMSVTLTMKSGATLVVTSEELPDNGWALRMQVI